MEAEGAEQSGLSDDFKQRVAQWETAGVFDMIAAKVGDVLEKEKGSHTTDGGWPGRRVP
jgi:hypothetical protein